VSKWYDVRAIEGEVHLSIFPYEDGGADIPIPPEEAKRLAEDLMRCILQAKKQRAESYGKD
jgi:hypothetical protein